MSDFLDLAHDVGQYCVPRSDYELVFKAERALRAAYANANLDLRNVESLWAAFEMAELMGHLPGLESDEIDRLCGALRRLVVATVTRCMTPRADPVLSAPPPYNDFAEKVLNDLTSWAAINFNYDTALEVAIGHKTNPADGSWREPWYLPSVLKLHGSLHWARCSNCGAIVPCRWGDIEEGMKISTKLAVQQHCGASCLPDPIIVPPTSSKKQGHQEVRDVWRRAAVELAEARNIFVIGYSLPHTDHFFREMFGLGTISARLRRLWIFDPVPGPVEGRWREFLGPDAVRYLKSFGLPFSKAIAQMRGALREDDSYG